MFFQIRLYRGPGLQKLRIDQSVKLRKLVQVEAPEERKFRNQCSYYYVEKHDTLGLLIYTP